MRWLDGGGHMGFMLIWWILVIVVLGAGIWFLARRGWSSGRQSESPEEILKRRYANGEIEREEYERRLSDLRK